MEKIIKSKFLRHLFVAFLTFTCTTGAWSQSKFHIDIDYHYYLGFSENFMGTTLSRDSYKMGGHAIHVAPRYDISSQWSAGIGIGLDRYTELDYNTLPVFATVRYKALKKFPNAYAFADLGYAIKVGDFTKGFTGSLGVGYTHMLSKRFGLNFQIAYNLKKFSDIPTYIYDIETDNTQFSKGSSTRHSLSLGIGITF